MIKSQILQVAIFTGIDHLLDYLPPVDKEGTEREFEQMARGMRVRVPIQSRLHTGMICGISDHSAIALEKLKPIAEILDTTPLLDEEMLHLLEWASHYYHHPLGEVIDTALPSLLSEGNSATLPTVAVWRCTAEGQAIELDKLSKKSQRQRELLAYLQQHPEGLSVGCAPRTISDEVRMAHPTYFDPLPVKSTLNTLEKKGWIASQLVVSPLPISSSVQPPPALNAAQQQAVQEVCAHLHQFYPCLLDGVTGSGKTEVYLRIIEEVLAQQRQALVLVPEINLTPQMIERFQQRFAVPLVVLHSRLSERERLHNWLYAREGRAAIVIGTRSAIWTPLARLGVLIVDEEHDLSYKQQDHFRYSARDIAVIRAQRAQVPILLGSATPSLESLHNVQRQRYHLLVLPERTGTAVHPTFHIVDMRTQARHSAISQPLRIAIEECLTNHQQVLLFINRRGYAPTLICYQCHWIATCPHCDAHLTYHTVSHSLLCHHCGAARRLDNQCPQCHHTQLFLVGQGTQRIESQITTLFPTARILRIDSDNTHKKNAIQTFLEQIHNGEADILVGTQMLAKGHHFPQVTLVGIINIDSGLFSVDFRSSERMAQLLMQVAGRAGRATEPGRVIIQTCYPDYPLLQRLIAGGYGAFTETALAERQQAELPPYSYLALIRAEAVELQWSMDFLHAVKEAMQQLKIEGTILWGPVSAPMEKRANRYRAQLLLQSAQRETLHNLLSQGLPLVKSLTSTKVRWSLDVDPQDLL